jgi:hypothetical protein
MRRPFAFARISVFLGEHDGHHAGGLLGVRSSLPYSLAAERHWMRLRERNDARSIYLAGAIGAAFNLLFWICWQPNSRRTAGGKTSTKAGCGY